MTRAEFVNRWEGEFVAYDDADFLADLNALLDAERASAREEQRAVDVAAVLAPAREKDPGLEQDHPEEIHAARVRRAALAATPLADRIAQLEAFGAKVNAIRDSIVGAQALNWSEHAYPLVAALDAAGFSGRPYPEARANVGTLLERLATAKRERDEARAEAARLADLHRRCEAYDDQPGPSCVQWRARAEKAEAKLTRITTEVLAELSAAGIATPERGYEVESWAISGDINRLAKERAEWKARAEKAEAALTELRDWPCEGVGCEVTLGNLESAPEGPGGGSWFCASCWNKALPAARRHGAEAQREACAKAVDLSPEDEADFKRLAEEIGAITDRSTLDDILVTIRATPLVTDKEPKR